MNKIYNLLYFLILSYIKVLRQNPLYKYNTHINNFLIPNIVLREPKFNSRLYLVGITLKTLTTPSRIINSRRSQFSGPVAN